MVPSVHVINMDGRRTLRFNGTLMPRDCPPQYVVDGMRIENGSPDEFSPQDIEAVEFYSAAGHDSAAVHQPLLLAHLRRDRHLDAAAGIASPRSAAPVSVRNDGSGRALTAAIAAHLPSLPPCASFPASRSPSLVARHGSQPDHAPSGRPRSSPTRASTRSTTRTPSPRRWPCATGRSSSSAPSAKRWRCAGRRRGSSMQGGHTIIPGMVDAHAHLLGLGDHAPRQSNLVGTKSYDEVIARVAAAAKGSPPASGSLGRGWDQNEWGDTRFPTHEALSRAVAEQSGRPHARRRTRRSRQRRGHARRRRHRGDARTRAAAASSATRTGEPTGVFVDNAKGLIDRVDPRRHRTRTSRSALRAAIAESQRYGLVGLHDAGESRRTIDLFEELAKAGEVPFRVYVMIGDDSAAIAHYFARGPQSALVRRPSLDPRDQALRRRRARLARRRAARALQRRPEEHRPARVRAGAPRRQSPTRALRAGFQVATHAIGDRGNRVVLDAYEAALKAHPTADHRFRIEHAQILNHDDIPRFAAARRHPVACRRSTRRATCTGPAAASGSGRLLGAYAWRSLLNTGVIIPNGSDFPVEAVNPAATRSTRPSRARTPTTGRRAAGSRNSG